MCVDASPGDTFLSFQRQDEKFDDFIKLICFFTINARKRRTTTTSKTLRERCRPDRFFLNEDECYLFLFMRVPRVCVYVYSVKMTKTSSLFFASFPHFLGCPTLILFSLTHIKSFPLAIGFILIFKVAFFLDKARDRNQINARKKRKYRHDIGAE